MSNETQLFSPTLPLPFQKNLGSAFHLVSSPYRQVRFAGDSRQQWCHKPSILHPLPCQRRPFFEPHVFTAKDELSSQFIHLDTVLFFTNAETLSPSIGSLSKCQPTAAMASITNNQFLLSCINNSDLTKARSTLTSDHEEEHMLTMPADRLREGHQRVRSPFRRRGVRYPRFLFSIRHR